MHYHAYKLNLMSRFGLEIIIRTRMLLHIDLLNSVFVLDKGKPGWSSWSDFGPCSSNCKKTRQRFCASSNKDEDCPGQSFGVESQEVVWREKAQQLREREGGRQKRRKKRDKRDKNHILREHVTSPLFLE